MEKKKGKANYTIYIDRDLMRDFRITCELEDFFVSEKLEEFMKKYVDKQKKERQKELHGA
jgi:hypothetical protein